MPRCPKCRCDLRVGEVKPEGDALIYRFLCANRGCANYLQTVAEEKRKNTSEGKEKAE